MLLSIDRVLQLLAEGKSVSEIADISKYKVDDICRIIADARKLLSEFNRGKSRKKYIIEKKPPSRYETDKDEYDSDKDVNEEDLKLFEGAELSIIPFGSSLVMYIDGASKGNPGPSGIGIVIYDVDDRQVGKVSSYLGIGTNNFAEYSALIRALKIAIYFKTNVLKIRTDSELVVKQLKGEYKVNSDKIRPLYNEAVKLKKMIKNCKIDHIPRSLNDKADYLANRAVSSS
ncbi:MAG: ribonuclease HI family protein [Spirochaetota bacterium]|nr:ribonuclease HI family protein [Spirochaetota bacterium]